ncbi:MAG: phosphatase PAP2 family protein [Candidatus Cloacimonetes bacterium]|nr:phosphatase PAP2 family protein [Candidatus Cloacimonadota bacterium]
MNRKLAIRELAILLVILFVGTYIFRTTDLDIRIQRLFFSQTEGWFLYNLLLFRLIYYYGNIPAILTVIGAIVFLVVGIKNKKYAIYRKINFFIILTMLIGPGLVVNAVYKEHWGRPRPRHITEFGGNEQHLRVWNKGISGTGNSFPCGHASMGYFFFVFYFIFRGKNRKLANISLLFALAFGSLIGLARIAQGGHFASDVLWTAGFLYLISFLLYHLLGMEANLYSTKELNSKISKPAIILLLALIPISVYLLLLATPYYKTKQINLSLSETNFNFVKIEVERGAISFELSDSLDLTYQAQGFGFPGSKIDYTKHVRTSQDTTYTELFIYQKGLFTELNNQITLTLAPDNNTAYLITVQKGQFYPLESQHLQHFEVVSKQNQLHISPRVIIEN